MEWMTMPYRRYADFSGRSRRKEFWMFQLFQFIVMIVLAVPMLALAPSGPTEVGGTPPISMFFILVLFVFALVNFIPALAVTVRRLHDQDLSGWFYFLSFIALVGGLILLYLMVVEGTQGANRYGPDSKY